MVASVIARCCASSSCVFLFCFGRRNVLSVTDDNQCKYRSENSLHLLRVHVCVDEPIFDQHSAASSGLASFTSTMSISCNRRTRSSSNKFHCCNMLAERIHCWGKA